ncbi:MAG: membrane-associated protein [Gammaproteobacteria bacterium]|nr:MAG: membrane-associated protein [Gammaproteobacteria bacterium]TND04002.1 MAG: membrane-associated protein [Gammaproteobacteria bacterium]
MDTSFLQALLDWVAHHPTWAGLLVFLIALTESLVIIGLFVPGATLIFGVGALIATGSMNLWSTLAWAIAGAIAGDGISFWIGHHYKQGLRTMWPFRRYPRLMERGERFFEKHGGKSILFGRFVGPVRPIIPAVAGMAGMSPGYFLLINVSSALVWAPANILPGMAFGASLGLASEVAARLAILVVVLVAALWLVQWMVRKVAIFIQPRANDMLQRSLAWSRSRRVLGPLTASVIDPNHPELRGLLILGTVLIVAATAFFIVVESLGGDSITRVNTMVFHFFEGLRTPFADGIMVAVSQLSSSRVNVPVFIAVLGWLAWQRRWLAAGHWMGAVIFGTLMASAMKALLHVERPPTLYAEIADYAFPSGHATMSVVIYGFLAVMIARERAGPVRWLPYVAAGSWVAMVALSRLYLGAHWLTDVLGGIALGLAWVALLGIAYRRHRPPPVSAGKLTMLVASTFLISGTWHVNQHHADELRRYTPVIETQVMDLEQWWNHSWQTLPAYRADLRARHHHPLTVQYAGQLDALRTQLEQHGWQPRLPLSFTSGLYWFSSDATINQLPVLPQVHDGWYESLVLVRDTGSPDRGLVLRLWPSYVELGTENNETAPLWIGNVSFYERFAPMPLFTTAYTGHDFDTPLTMFREDVSGLVSREALRPLAETNAVRPPLRWDGTVLLLQQR